MNTIDAREFLKDTIRQQIDFAHTDQSRGVPAPPIEKPFDPAAIRIPLPAPQDWALPPVDVISAISRRQSQRRFTPEALSIEELALLLWATQGIRGYRGEHAAFRTVPSAGCRHAFETYLWLMRVIGVEPGCYRYLPQEHELLLEFRADDMAAQISQATLGQNFAGEAAVTFAWAAVPYRMEWRYGAASVKVIALDAGHVCQNLYLACDVIGAGACAIAAYDQEACDRLFRLDGVDEFVIYLAPVGKIHRPASASK